VTSFIPWALAIYVARLNVLATTSWTNSKLSFPELFRSWIVGIVRLFFDVGNQSGDTVTELLPVLVILLPLMLLIGWSLQLVYRNTQSWTSLFIFILIGSSFLPLAISDLVNGGSRISAAQRYLIPTYLGLQLSVAFFLAERTFDEEPTARRRIWLGATLLVLSLGGVSCWVSRNAEAWWNKDPDGANPKIATLVNNAASPLLVSDGWMGHLLSLSSRLRDDVKIRIDPLCYVCSGFDLSRGEPVFAGEFRDVFYFHPGFEPPRYLPAFARSTEYGRLQPLVSQRGRVALWRIERTHP
jgi:uncharacterized membrane protein